MTCAFELLQSGLDFPLELLRGDDDFAPKLLLMPLQLDFTVNYHLLEPLPLLIQLVTYILHLWWDWNNDKKQSSECLLMCRYIEHMTSVFLLCIVGTFFH